jgi:hypothetical protein
LNIKKEKNKLTCYFVVAAVDAVGVVAIVAVAVVEPGWTRNTDDGGC